MDSEVTIFAIEWFSKWYPQEVNIPHVMIPESNVLHSGNNISVKDWVWREGVESDFKNMFLKFMILYLVRHQSLCITHCLLVIQVFDIYIVTWTIFSLWKADQSLLRNVSHWNSTLLPILVWSHDIWLQHGTGTTEYTYPIAVLKLIFVMYPMAVPPQGAHFGKTPKWCRAAPLVKKHHNEKLEWEGGCFSTLLL